MTAIRVKTMNEQENGKRVVEAFIVADTTPEELPTTGDGVKGLMPSDTFAPFCVLYVTDSADVYVTNEHGEFVKQ